MAFNQYASPAWNMKELAVAPARNLLTGGWEITTGKLPPTPDRHIMVRDAGGPSSEPGLAINYPQVQFIVRGRIGGDSYGEAYTKAADIKNAFLGVPITEWEELTSVTMIGDITPMGFDDKDRALMSLNFQLIVSFDTIGHRT